jgi:hypothetical protein
MPRIRLLWLVTRLVVNYIASCRLVVDYFAYAARPGASTRLTAHHVARHAARRRLFHLRCASGCLGTSRGSSRCPLSITSPKPRVRVPRHVAWLVVDYFVSRRLIVNFFFYAACPGASARRVARRRLLILAQARPRLLHLHRASGCLGTSCGSSSTTSHRAARRRLLRLA